MGAQHRARASAEAAIGVGPSVSFGRCRRSSERSAHVMLETKWVADNGCVAALGSRKFPAAHGPGDALPDLGVAQAGLCHLRSRNLAGRIDGKGNRDPAPQRRLAKQSRSTEPPYMATISVHDCACAAWRRVESCISNRNLRAIRFDPQHFRQADAKGVPGDSGRVAPDATDGLVPDEVGNFVCRVGTRALAGGQRLAEGRGTLARQADSNAAQSSASERSSLTMTSAPINCCASHTRLSSMFSER